MAGWEDVSPYSSIKVVPDGRTYSLSSNLRSFSLSISPLFTINTGSTYCCGTAYQKGTIAQNMSVLGIGINQNIYENTNHIEVNYYDQNGYTNILSSAFRGYVVLYNSGSNYYLGLYFEGQPQANSKSAKYTVDFYNSNNSGLASFTFEINTPGSSAGVNLTFRALPSNNGTPISTYPMSTHTIGNVNGSSNFNIFFPTYVYTTHDQYHYTGDNPSKPFIYNYAPIVMKSDGLFYYAPTSYSGTMGTYDFWVPSTSTTGTFTADLIYDTKEYVDISYVSYNVTSTPIYNSMGTVHAGSYLTAPSASSAGSLQGHKFRSWRYNNSDVSPGASFKTYPSIKNLYSDWDPIKLQVYHNGNWTSANIYVAHGNILSPPDLIKVFLNGQWVEV